MTSLSEAALWMNILDCLLGEEALEDDDFSKFLELEDFFFLIKLIWLSEFWCEAHQMNDFKP